MDIIKHVPGFIAAIIAFVVLKLISLIGSLSLEILSFFAVYIIVTICVDMAMKRYGEKGEN